MPSLALWGLFLSTSYWVVSTVPVCAMPVHAVCSTGLTLAHNLCNLTTPTHAACLVASPVPHAVALL